MATEKSFARMSDYAHNQTFRQGIRLQSQVAENWLPYTLSSCHTRV
jgi:hypothetical protein